MAGALGRNPPSKASENETLKISQNCTDTFSCASKWGQIKKEDSTSPQILPWPRFGAGPGTGAELTRQCGGGHAGPWRPEPPPPPASNRPEYGRRGNGGPTEMKTLAVCVSLGEDLIVLYFFGILLFCSWWPYPSPAPLHRHFDSRRTVKMDRFLMTPSPGVIKPWYSQLLGCAHNFFQISNMLNLTTKILRL